MAHALRSRRMHPPTHRTHRPRLLTGAARQPGILSGAAHQSPPQVAHSLRSRRMPHPHRPVHPFSLPRLPPRPSARCPPRSRSRGFSRSGQRGSYGRNLAEASISDARPTPAPMLDGDSLLPRVPPVGDSVGIRPALASERGQSVPAELRLDVSVIPAAAAAAVPPVVQPAVGVRQGSARPDEAAWHQEAPPPAPVISRDHRPRGRARGSAAAGRAAAQVVAAVAARTRTDALSG